jgi:hypothetical protein
MRQPRKIANLDAQTHKRLEELARREGESIAGIVRRLSKMYERQVI